MGVAFVPIGGELDALREVGVGLPVEPEMGLRDVEHQEVGLMEGIGIRDILEGAFSVELREEGGHLPDWGDALRARAKVPALAVSGGFLQHLTCQEEIATQRLQDMLPGANGLGTSDFNRSAGLQGPDAIGDDAILGPVTTTNHITCPTAGNGNMVGFAVVLRVEETPAPGTDGNLGSPLGRAIGIIAAHGFVFTIAPDLFTVLVALIGGNHDHHPYTVCDTGSLHDVDGAHDIGLIGLNGNLVTETYQRLGCEVEDYLGLILGKDGLHFCSVANISAEISLDFPTYAREDIVILFRIGIQPYPDDLGSQFVEPDAEPRAFEACMSCDQDTLSFESTVENVYHSYLMSSDTGTERSHFFQGARSSCRSLSRRFFSRMLSMHCQKPSWI